MENSSFIPFFVCDKPDSPDDGSRTTFNHFRVAAVVLLYMLTLFGLLLEKPLPIGVSSVLSVFYIR
jgi:hypothetical protein